jgi:hypothetical protein
MIGQAGRVCQENSRCFKWQLQHQNRREGAAPLPALRLGGAAGFGSAGLFTNPSLL